MAEKVRSDKVGIREFRENLASYLEAETPVTITRHGAPVGVYVPARRASGRAELDALLTAGETLDALIAQAGADEEDLVREFRRRRKAARKATA